MNRKMVSEAQKIWHRQKHQLLSELIVKSMLQRRVIALFLHLREDRTSNSAFLIPCRKRTGLIKKNKKINVHYLSKVDLSIESMTQFLHTDSSQWKYSDYHALFLNFLVCSSLKTATGVAAANQQVTTASCQAA